MNDVLQNMIYSILIIILISETYIGPARDVEEDDDDANKRQRSGDLEWRTMALETQKVTLSATAKIRRSMGHLGYGLCQWETTLQCNVVCHWLSP